MTDQPQESIQLTEKDEADLAFLNSEEEQKITHTVLEMWRDILTSAVESATLPIGIDFAARTVGRHSGLKVQDVRPYYVAYCDYLGDLLTILEQELKDDPHALKNIEDDATENKTHYLNVLMLWQRQAQQWEKEWDSSSETAHITLPAIADAMMFAFGAKGITNLLDAIKFDLTEADQAQIIEGLMDGGEGE